MADEGALKDFKHDVDSAVDLLRVLTKTKASHQVGTSQWLPPEELQVAQGVAFIETVKVGFIVSALKGHGFLLNKVPGSPSGWSAPLLFEASSLGLGATAGFSKVSTLLVLDTAQAVSDFLHTQITLNSAMTVAAGQAARDMQSTEMNLSHPNNTFSSATYSVAQGGMIDVSFQGVKISVNESGMRKLYGTEVKSTDVLDGRVPQVPGLEPLIAEMQLIMRGGGATPAERH